MHNQLRLGRIKLQADAPTDPDYLSNVHSYHVSWSVPQAWSRPGNQASSQRMQKLDNLSQNVEKGGTLVTGRTR